MLQIVQNGEKCKKPKKWDFQPKITKCAPYVVYCLNQCLDICHVFFYVVCRVLFCCWKVYLLHSNATLDR